MNRYLRLPLDKNKRHFIIGDIHGKYKGLLELLEQVGYDENEDILYTVGDQIDRGDQSMEVIRFFEEDNRYTIMGNHEHMAIDARWYGTWLANGGVSTIQSAREHGLDAEDLIPLFEDLPYIIDVGEDGDPDSFRLVHAEVPIDWDETYLMNKLRAGDHADLADLIWSRKTITAAGFISDESMMALAKDRKAANSRRVFCGHTPVPGNPLSIGNQMYIDTGYYKLTCVEAMSGDSVTINAPLHIMDPFSEETYSGD